MILEKNLVPNDIPDRLAKLKNMYEDLFSGGKGYRGALVEAISEELGLPETDRAVLSRSIEYIHNSSLLHDDFVDDAPLRRGKESAWKKYGGGYAILGGDYLLAKVIKNLTACGSLELIEYTSDTILKLVEGEWLQDACQKRANVNEIEMKEVHALKTSTLFGWCFKAPALISKKIRDRTQVENLYQIGNLFGELLQSSDDLLDYNIRNFENKAYFRDLPSGYFNLFTIFLLKDFSEEERKKAFEFSKLEDFISYYSLNVETAVKEFDKGSVRIIEELNSLIDNQVVFSKDFKESLKTAGKQIYWRS